MAIHDALPGIVVSVSVARNQLKEYEREREQEELGAPLAGCTISRYIESTSDSEFAINLEISPLFQFDCPTLQFDIYVDGQFILSPVCGVEHLTYGRWAMTVTGLPVKLSDGSEAERRFKFASIKTIDDADRARIENDKRRGSHIGEITVKIFRKGKLEKVESDSLKIVDTDNTVREIAEKALKGKALSHSTTFLPPVPRPKRHVYRSKHLDGRDKPIAVFDFRYLSKEALQQQLVIPRLPSPDPYDALTEAEKERLARQKLAELKASKTKREIKSEKIVKRERSIDGGAEIIDLSGDTFARNASIRPFKMVKMADGQEAIDLTD